MSPAAVAEHTRDAPDLILEGKSGLRDVWQDAEKPYSAWKKSIEGLKARV